MRPRHQRVRGRRARASQTRLGWGAALLLVLTASLLSGLVGTFAYFFPAAVLAFQATGQSAEVRSSPSPVAVSPSWRPSPTPPPASGAFTVLLLGSDDDDKFFAEHVLTQSMILVRVDPKAKQVTMLSIPRDLYVPLSVGGSGKIDGAYSYGGPGAAVATVQNNFHVHIDEWCWIGLRGLIDLIDQVGGIDLVTTHPVFDDFYPADTGSGDPYGYERVAVLAGPQHLDGAHALQYVRSRHDDLRSDFGRSERQQQVLVALRAKARMLGPADVPWLAQVLGGEVKTSMSVTRIVTLLPLADSFGDPNAVRQIVLGPPYTHGGTVVDGQSVLTPNWGEILPLVRQYFP